MRRVGLHVSFLGVDWPGGRHSSIAVHLWSSAHERESPGGWPSMRELDSGELMTSQWVIDTPEASDDASPRGRPERASSRTPLGKADAEDVVAAVAKVAACVREPSWSMLTRCDGSSEELEIDARDYKLRLEWSEEVPAGWLGVQELVQLLCDLDTRARRGFSS